MLVVCIEVFKRYALNAPTAWIFDVNNMMYGTLFMMCGAYTLAQDGHVRGDFLYGSMKPRTQAALDLVLYFVFFLPGICALTWAGWTYFDDSLAMHEQTFNATPLPVYPFKFIIPVAGAIVLMQGIAEILRCVVCLKHGRMAVAPEGCRGDRRRRAATVPAATSSTRKRKALAIEKSTRQHVREVDHEQCCSRHVRCSA